jgi:hypothetical protein
MHAAETRRQALGRRRPILEAQATPVQCHQCRVRFAAVQPQTMAAIELLVVALPKFDPQSDNQLIGSE